MCFHNSMNKRLKQLAERYGRKTDIVETYKEILEKKYHVTAFTNPDYPIITKEEEIQDFKWGLIPFWTKDMEKAKDIRKKTYNARAETVFDLPSYRMPIRKQRCIIPSTGYFEWRHEKGNKIPYFIYVKDQPVFSMGGMYDYWINPETGEEISTFSMITTEANELTGYIHNGGNNPHRMPLILSPENEEKWLSDKLSAEDIKSLLKPFIADKMDAYMVDKNFIKMNPEDKDIIEPASENSDQ